jgi:phosphoribosylformylglycinamidine synthase
MGARGDHGMDIDVSLVPQRETGMTPYEIMLSESQERMLLVVKRGREHEVERIFEKWDLHAVRIGEVTGEPVLTVRAAGAPVASIPNKALTDEAPVYSRPLSEPRYLRDVQALDLADVRPADPQDAFRALLQSPVIASKQWVYRQYDHMVRTNTLVLPGAGTGVVRIKGTNRALAVSVDGNGRYCYLDPYRGAMLAVAEAARNVACAGAEPIGATNCLNCGNPERPEIMWQFARVVDGIAEACRVLEIPITGGNVSLYNETEGRAIYPTPVLGVVGLIEDSTRICARGWRGAGDLVVLLGETRDELGGSEYLKILHDMIRGVPPAIDLEAERALQQLLVSGIRAGWLRSAHDCAEGGLGVTLAECCFGAGSIGLDVELPAVGSATGGWPAVASLFAESPSRAIVSVAPSNLPALLERASALGVSARQIGRTGGPSIRVVVNGAVAVDVSVRDADAAWEDSIGRHFTRQAA